MSLLETIRGALPAGHTHETDSQPITPQTDGRAELERRRDQLAVEVTELHWDLGGLVYEMAIRDHFRLDVLVGRAALLQERDAELAEVERLLHTQQTATAGNCGACGALRSRGAVFCWQCGTALMGTSDAPTSTHRDPVGGQFQPQTARATADGWGAHHEQTLAGLSPSKGQASEDSLGAHASHGL